MKQNIIYADILPPPLGEVYVGAQGTVIMSKETFDQIRKDIYEFALEEIRRGNDKLD